MTALAIEARGLDVAYGRVQVLFDVDLVVQEGETLALLGTNGAGKSTLLRAITGLVPTTGGVLRIAGHDAASLSTEQRVRLGLAHLMGGGATFGPLTTQENLQAATCRYRPDDAKRRVASAFDLFPELEVVREAPARTLSGGQEQMLALAMALVHEPPVLLIDELSLGLAPIVVERVLDVVRTMQADGTSLVVVEQSLDIAVSIADRALFLERGRVRFDGSTAELMEREDLARSMFLGH
jgi:ABC-type branched-subunit amino acid transport system ATPase component